MSLLFSQFLRDEISLRSNINKKKIIRHLIAGTISTLGYFLCVTFLIEIMYMRPVFSVMFSFGLLQIVTYFVNRGWVYEATNRHSEALPRFILVIGFSWFLNASIMYVVVDVYALAYFWGLVLAAAIIPATNIALNVGWVFR